MYNFLECWPLTLYQGVFYLVHVSIRIGVCFLECWPFVYFVYFGVCFKRHNGKYVKPFCVWNFGLLGCVFWNSSILLVYTTNNTTIERYLRKS